MTDKKIKTSKQAPSKKRQDSLGEALRNNLLRRKQQKRERSEEGTEEDKKENLE